MIERMKALLKDGDMCVLATCSDNRPHCSLMGYVTDPDAETLYMVTLKDSRKYRNVVENPHVSLLVDTREEIPELGRAGVKALTVHGICRPLSSDEGHTFLDRLARRHPQLAGLTRDPNAVVLEVKVEGLLLLDGVAQAHYRNMSS
jgi:nitroimidazol reductase NimA-like FMN-containing flavoprotein (pyridoxamine 5'-phosphate oxidase superfamily)